MEPSEHRRAQDMAEAGAWLICATGEADRDVLAAWLAIPNEPDCHPYVMRLQDRVGEDRVHRVSDLVEVARQRTGLRYGEFQAAMRNEMAKPGALYVPTGLCRASFGALKIVEFPPAGRPVVVDECMTSAGAFIIAGGAVWPNVRRVYDDRGSVVAFYAPPVQK